MVIQIVQIELSDIILQNVLISYAELTKSRRYVKDVVVINLVCLFGKRTISKILKPVFS